MTYAISLLTDFHRSPPWVEIARKEQYAFVVGWSGRLNEKGVNFVWSDGAVVSESRRFLQTDRIEYMEPVPSGPTCCSAFTARRPAAAGEMEK